MMSLAAMEQLKLTNMKKTSMTLNLADRSKKHPCEIIEDVWVKVDSLIFPVDFVILPMEENIVVSILLG